MNVKYCRECTKEQQKLLKTGKKCLIANVLGLILFIIREIEE